MSKNSYKDLKLEFENEISDLPDKSSLEDSKQNKKLDLNNNEVDLNNNELDNKSTFAIDQEIEVMPIGFQNYGVFCECGDGFTGLVHISKITPKFVKNVSDYFTIGKPFKAKIIGINGKQLKLSTKEFNLEATKS